MESLVHKILSSVIASGTALLAAPALAQAADKAPVTITILHTNDIHGHITAWQGWEGELFPGERVAKSIRTVSRDESMTAYTAKHAGGSACD